MPRTVVLVACLTGSPFLGACATIAHGRHQIVKVTSTPEGARVSMNGLDSGITPARLVLDRKEPRAALRFEKDGYESVELPLKRGTSGWVLGDVLLGGAQLGNQGLSSSSQTVVAAAISTAVYVGIDLVTGAAHTFDRNEVHVVLKQRAAGPEGLRSTDPLLAYPGRR